MILQGNELGLVDYTYWAFKLYGISINALVLFYFTLLFISVALFFVTFRQSPFCLLLLMLYLAGALLRAGLCPNPRHSRHPEQPLFPGFGLAAGAVSAPSHRDAVRPDACRSLPVPPSRSSS